MQRLAQRTHHGYFITDTAEPLAFSAGWFRAVAIVSRGLHRAVSAADLEVIIYHEMAHGERRDNLRQFLATGASALFRPAARGRLLADLRVAAEEACDAHAALQVGDRLRVAGAILKYARLTRRMPECEVAAFGASATVERVHELLAPSTRRIGVAQWTVAVLAVAAAL